MVKQIYRLVTGKPVKKQPQFKVGWLPVTWSTYVWTKIDHIRENTVKLVTFIVRKLIWTNQKLTIQPKRSFNRCPYKREPVQFIQPNILLKTVKKYFPRLQESCACHSLTGAQQNRKSFQLISVYYISLPFTGEIFSPVNSPANCRCGEF